MTEFTKEDFERVFEWTKDPDGALEIIRTRGRHLGHPRRSHERDIYSEGGLCLLFCILYIKYIQCYNKTSLFGGLL